MTVRLTGELSEFAVSNIGENGDFDNMSEYIRSLIRHDKARIESQAFERLKAELELAFSASDKTYHPLTASAIFDRN
ncbi:MAG: addiction module antitoxin [Kangiella sp.]|nr:MAG: addiction module antitoxin [Kangiella sp.]